VRVYYPSVLSDVTSLEVSRLVFCVSAAPYLLVIRMWFFSNGFLSDSFLLCKTFRSIKGGIKCCSVGMVSCVAYSFSMVCRLSVQLV
jgi:hypothetical protein